MNVNTHFASSSDARFADRRYSYFGLILLMMISGLSLVFLYNGFEASNRGDSMGFLSYFFLGTIGLILSALMLNRMMGRMNPPQIKVTVTLTECLKCAMKTVRNFQVGDYIPKPMGACGNCGGEQIIQAIYVEEKPRERGTGSIIAKPS